MSAAVDTNILIYAAGNDWRQSLADRLLRSGLSVSVISLNEFADVARRKLRWPLLKVMDAMNDFHSGLLDVLPLTVEMQSLGVNISYRHGLRIYDACIIASAALAGCDTLYTEDLHHDQVIEGVRIINPFL